jgi:hypothetical protein
MRELYRQTAQHAERLDIGLVKTGRRSMLHPDLKAGY